MTTTELKKLAEAATVWDAETYRAFHAAANPAAILKLLAINAELVEALKLASQIIGHPDDSRSQHIAEVIAKAEGGEL